ncbi:MAG: XcyI family restriction endonuclease [Bacteroidia bacterium]|nr:XcyI family restriction endonuclease [Bacteroidia bacterium]
MPQSRPYPVLDPQLQIDFFEKLQEIKEQYFYPVLKKSIKKVAIKEINDELDLFAPAEGIQKLAQFSLRGEVFFPVPCLLKANPFLLGYYRLLLGFSQKEFYSKGPFGSFKSMEEKGKLLSHTEENLNRLCTSLCNSSMVLVDALDLIRLKSVEELQLLTIGPQFRGSMNNILGQHATRKTFEIIKSIVDPYIDSVDPNRIVVTNESGRKVEIRFASDPDIEIFESLNSRTKGLISIEIKGGRDVSNIHNRIGEAEKSHQKAKKRGFFEFMTIVSVEVSYDTLAQESPTTSHFFNLDKISDKSSAEFAAFSENLGSVIGIRI